MAIEENDGFFIMDMRNIIGDAVVCDLCNNQTDELDEGGGVFSTTGVCPRCWPEFAEGAKKYPEEAHLFYPAPPGWTHNRFIRLFRDDPQQAIRLSQEEKDGEV